jgi:hypothetical protein
MVTAFGGWRIIIPLFLQPLKARKQIPSIQRIVRQIQTLHWLPVVLDQWRIPSVRAFAAS